MHRRLQRRMHRCMHRRLCRWHRHDGRPHAVSQGDADAQLERRACWADGITDGIADGGCHAAPDGCAHDTTELVSNEGTDGVSDGRAHAAPDFEADVVAFGMADGVSDGVSDT